MSEVEVLGSHISGKTEEGATRGRFVNGAN